MWDEVEQLIGPNPEQPDGSEEEVAAWERARERYRRAIAKTPQYTEFHNTRIEKGQRASSLIGNQYTGSIFLALMSTFESDFIEGTDLSGLTMGLCGYGSGAKAKVFEGRVNPKWREVVARWHLFERLQGRTSIDNRFRRTKSRHEQQL